MTTFAVVCPPIDTPDPEEKFPPPPRLPMELCGGEVDERSVDHWFLAAASLAVAPGDLRRAAEDDGTVRPGVI